MDTASIRSGVAATSAALAALLVGVCAGVVLVQPFTPDLAVAMTDTGLRWWVLSRPIGVVVGAVAAPVVCLAMVRLRGRRLSAVAVGAVVILAVAEFGLGQADCVAALVAQRYVEAAFAGAALGATAAVLHTRRVATAALAAGATAALLLSAAAVTASGVDTPRRYADYLPSTPSTSMRTGWLIALAGVLLVVTIAVEFGSSAGKHVPAVRWRPVAAVVLLALGGVASAAVATAQTPTNWWFAGPALTLALLVAGAAALLLPGADGLVVFAVTAISAAGALAAVVFDRSVLPDPIMIALLAALILLGVAAGVRWRAPGTALVVLAATVAAGTVPVSDPGMLHAVLLLVGAAAVGVALGSALPGSAVGTSVGVGALFLPGAAAAVTGAYQRTWAVAGGDFGWVPYTPLTSLPPGESEYSPSLSILAITGDGQSDTVTVWALAALVLGCAGGVVLLRRLR